MATKEDPSVGAVNALDLKILKTSGFVGWVLSMEIMASTQEMKLKQDPESISLDNSIQLCQY